ncbi:MAG: hypothetical protein ACK5H2_11400 [Beutenbergiaceae bacterium]
MSVSLPRSVVAALWVSHADSADDWLVRASAAITGTDEPHRTTEDAPLAVLLTQLLELRGTTFAALPVPHQPVGLTGVAAVAAMDAGECIVVDPGAHQPGLVAVPEVTAFGSALEPGAMVRWQTHHAQISVAPVGLSEARSMLAEALVVAVDALESMDVARWRPDAAEEIAELASAAVPHHIADALPAELDPRRAHLLVRAARLEAIAELAMADDGAAVTLWAADQRHAALRHVAGAARQAMTAASTFPPPGPR